jgi:hypothetical protein
VQCSIFGFVELLLVSCVVWLGSGLLGGCGWLCLRDWWNWLAAGRRARGHGGAVPTLRTAMLYWMVTVCCGRGRVLGTLVDSGYSVGHSRGHEKPVPTLRGGLFCTGPVGWVVPVVDVAVDGGIGPCCSGFY